MAYGLKYEAEFQNTRKHYYRVRIYMRDYSGSSKTMGYVAGAALEIQGNSARIIDPIIKTQFRLSLVDKSDQAETNNVKYGDWQEFFTPDATLYKVVLGQSLDGTDYTDIWSGYITPDSWVENIEYEGIITITARDGLGQLKDYQFEEGGLVAPDNNGLVSIYSILNQVNYVFGMPMDIVSHINTAETLYNPPRFSAGDYVDSSIEDARVNIDLFEGMNWYDVLEQTLESIGCAIRYNGQNKLVIMALRDLPKLGRNDGAFDWNPVEFYGCTLEFDPAVKRIVEEQDYKQKPEVNFNVFEGLQFNTKTTYRCKTDGNTLPGGGVVHVPEHDADMNVLYGQGRTGWDPGSGMLNPAAYEPDDFLKRAEGTDGWRNYAFIAANQVLNGSSPTATYRFQTRTAAITMTFRFTPHATSIVDSGSATGKMQGPSYALANIKYYVMFTDGTTTRYWNGGQWTNSAILLEQEYDAQNQYGDTLEINTSECEEIDVGTMVVRFGQITYKMWVSGGHGCYARVVEIKAEINSTTSLQSNKVTTVNDDAFNVVLTRKPLFGALSQEVAFVRPSNYLAALFTYPSYNGYAEACPYEFYFGDETPIPLPVLIHQQILCYYYGAARVLNGNCAPINNGRVLFNKICVYKNHKYIIQGGTLDLFSGILQNAVLREYLDFDELWDGTAPSYSGTPSYKADPATGGGNGGGGGGSVSPYVLPIASNSVLGGIKVGTGLSIDPVTGILSASGGGGGGSTVSVQSLSSDTSTDSRIAKITIDETDTYIYNDVKWGTYDSTNKVIDLKINGTTRAVCLDGYSSGGGSPYTLPIASSSVLGGIKVGSGLSIDANGVLSATGGGGGGSAVSWGTPGSDYVPLSVDGTTKNLLTAHQSLSNYVTINTAQTITGEKTFTTKPVNIGSSSGIKVNSSSYIDIGPLRLKYDAGSKGLHITKADSNDNTVYSLYADGAVSAGGVHGDALSLANLADVAISSPSAGQFLVYRSGNWVNETPATTVKYVSCANDSEYNAISPKDPSTLYAVGSPVTKVYLGSFLLKSS